MSKTPSDLIYDAVYKGALAKKVKESRARDAAIMAVDEFKKGKYAAKKERPTHLIDRYITHARKVK